MASTVTRFQSSRATVGCYHVNMEKVSTSKMDLIKWPVSALYKIERNQLVRIWNRERYGIPQANQYSVHLFPLLSCVSGGVNLI